ncbi:hypothetical protein [Verrucosispora sp. WMMD573]|uniref:hypothetical protein n=1 Tax=Verrucosispora sp. WMMD573 TaxID=3015149 RepID=UPI00248D001E|nr:hypothetical protein [Verrucosispora sp. WMMD573]WBB55484.1 hypothetical protein O7601_05030 [Verrucosispora sp. WMMD573]
MAVNSGAGEAGISVSRRQVLSLAGLTLGIGVVDLGGRATGAAAAPASTEPSVRLEPLADDPVRMLSATSAAVASVPRQLAVRVVNEQAPLPIGTTLTISFDPRLYAPTSSAVVTVGDRRVASRSVVTTDEETGAVVCRITLDEAVPVLAAGAGAVALVATASPGTYPYDLMHRPKEAVAEIGRSAGERLSRRGLRSARELRARSGLTPWGLELSGGWGRHVWGDAQRFVYFHPQLITIAGTGPGRSPETAFTVLLDPHLVQQIDVESVRLNGKRIDSRVRQVSSTTEASVYRTRWRSSVRLGSGDVLEVRLSSRMKTPTGALAAIKHPVVEVDGMGLDPGQRQTRLTTWTRLDSVWE